MRILIKTILFVFFAAPVFAGTVGERIISFSDKNRNRNLVATIWYPADPKAQITEIRDGPFRPRQVAVDAAFRENCGKLPLILLSHGSGGTASKLFWLAEKLVQDGTIVLAVNHPGNMKGDNSADGMLRVWDRALDLSFALDQLLLSRQFKKRIENSKVAAAGHSAGGTTVLLLGGARFSSDQFTNPTPNCASTDDLYFKKLCDQLRQEDFKKYPRETVENDYGDIRIKAVAALDPGFARSFEKQSLIDLKAQTSLFIAESLREPADEIYSKDFLTLLPSVSKVVPSSIHMSFLTACKAEIQMDEPELKSLCADNENKIRIQQQVAKQVSEFFQRVWETK